MSSEITKTERDQTIKLDVSAKVYPTKDPKQEKGSVLPSQFGKDKQHHDICFPTTSAMREALNTVVMDAYRDVLEQQATRAAQAVERLSERSTKPSLRGALQNAMKDVASRPPQEGQRTAEQGAR